jgi:hypothetical protein
MWATLQDPGFLIFYQDFHDGRYFRDEDWQPMIRAVRHLQSQPYASALFAFTSLAHLCVTTAPTFEACAGHHSIGITWAFAERRFHLRYYTDSWIADQPPEIVCEEVAFAVAVDAFVQRLLMTSPAPSS